MLSVGGKMSNTLLIKKLREITHHLVYGNEAAVDELMDFLRKEKNCHEEVIALAEELNLLSLQRDIYAFRLEGIIEDLLEAQRDADQAKHDPLTGLPNRAIFHQLLEQECQQPNVQSAVLFIDLDKFKQVNDTLGHDAGDEILQIASQRMQSCVKEHDSVCRLGGDEFTIILRHIDSQQDVSNIAQRLLDQLALPCHLRAGPAQIGASIGISLFPQDANNAIGLLKNADIAMYEAKEHGRNGFVYFHGAKPMADQ